MKKMYLELAPAKPGFGIPLKHPRGLQYYGGHHTLIVNPLGFNKDQIMQHQVITAACWLRQEIHLQREIGQKLGHQKLFACR
eukprot:3927780-Karenia_brevis.AAC.1